MNSEQQCDFCGRTGQMLEQSWTEEPLVLEIDTDGLWMCPDCKGAIRSRPTDLDTESSMEPGLMELVGKSAGAICYTLNLPNQPPYEDVIEAASLIAYDHDLYMSAWKFISQMIDGSTIWQSPDGSRKAFVTLSGSVRIETM